MTPLLQMHKQCIQARGACDDLARYQILVVEQLDELWTRYINGLELVHPAEIGHTVFRQYPG
jgi:hypothetical protein